MRGSSQQSVTGRHNVDAHNPHRGLMARISEKDALRLGLIKPGSAPALPSRRRHPPPVARKPGFKPGRIDRALDHGPFDVIVEIPLEPKTKHRPRTHRPERAIEKAFLDAHGSLEVFRRLLGGVKSRTITPQDTRAFEEAVTMIAKAAMRGQGEPYAGPVRLDVVFVLTGDPALWPTSVTDPDLDNMEKAATDALNRVVWRDDRLVVSKTSAKVCGADGAIRMRIRDAFSAGIPDGLL